MVELCAMSNATGFIPDIPGAHGLESDVAGLNAVYRLKEYGGVLHRHGVVEYVNGIAPGVFVTVTTDNPEVAYQLDYLAMGAGPLWTFYRPYHLCSIETPISIARAVLDHEATIIPKAGLVSECVAIAKRDLSSGELLDGIGGTTVYGSIVKKQESDYAGYLPLGLITPGARLNAPVRRGEVLTYGMVDLDESTNIYQLRKIQDSLDFGG